VDRRKGDERGGLNRRLRGTRSYLLVSQAKLPPPRRFASLSLATPRYSITNSTVPVLSRYSGPPDRPLSVADHRWHIGNGKRTYKRIAIHATLLQTRSYSRTTNLGLTCLRVIFFSLISREDVCIERPLSSDSRVSLFSPSPLPSPSPPRKEFSCDTSSIVACVKMRVD